MIVEHSRHMECMQNDDDKNKKKFILNKRSAHWFNVHSTISQLNILHSGKETEIYEKNKWNIGCCTRMHERTNERTTWLEWNSTVLIRIKVLIGLENQAKKCANWCANHNDDRRSERKRKKIYERKRKRGKEWAVEVESVERKRVYCLAVAYCKIPFFNHDSTIA